jgi:hypothetical protein
MGMSRRTFALLAVAAFLPLAFAQKRKEGKPPEIELIDPVVRRQGELIIIDGKVKNVSDKPVKELAIFFDFLFQEKVITTKRGGIDDPVLEPGDEAEFHAQIEAPPRATHYQVHFEDGGSKYLRPAHNGPFPID